MWQKIKEKWHASVLPALISKEDGERRPWLESVTAIVGGVAVAAVIVYGLSHTAGTMSPSGDAANTHAHSHSHSSDLPMSPATFDSEGDALSGITGQSVDPMLATEEDSCLITTGKLSEKDLKMARIAWTYFENNYNPDTGLVNAVNNFPSTTMWDTGSALAATIAAYDFGFLDKKSFDDRITALIRSLASMELFNDESPNKVYNTKTMAMVDYANKVTETGIGVSALDLARLMSWGRILGCWHPKYNNGLKSSISRWKFDSIIRDGSMYGLARDKSNPDEIKAWQEGRLGYEQYAGKIFQRFGFKADVAADYENEFRGDVEILGVNIAHDNRDPREWHANNYVLTESYTMDAMELGRDDQNRDLVRNIFEVQKRRWQETGIVTAISEDNIDQKPWFLYNTIYNAGQTWTATNSSDVPYPHLKTISVKAAISMALLYPEDEYSAVLMDAVESAYDPKLGWYSGIYESGAGYNKVATANTNGVILSGFLYKKYGELLPHCQSCSEDIILDSELLKQPLAKEPVVSECEICARQ